MREILGIAALIVTHIRSLADVLSDFLPVLDLSLISGGSGWASLVSRSAV